MLAQYRAVLSKPGAFVFSSAAWVGRLWLSMTNLGILLLTTATTHRYGIAGAVSATYSITGAVAQPYLGRLTDRFGQARILLPLVAVHAAGVVALLLLAEGDAPHWTLFAAAVPTGVCCPPLGSQVRARWSALLGAGRQLDTAYAMESVLDELLFVVGPVLVTVLSTSVDPAAGLLTALAFTVGGTVVFALQRHTEPESTQELATSPSPLRIPAIRVVATTYLMVGLLFGTTDVTMVAFATQHGSRAYTGWLLAIVSAGSAIGGLWYGSRHWRRPAERRFTTSVGSLAIFSLGVALAPNLATMPIAGALMGMSIAPAIISSSLMIQKYCPPDRRTEGFAYIGSSLGAGFALGSAIAGRVDDHHSTHLGFAIGTCAMVLAFLVALQGRKAYTSASLTGPVHDDLRSLTVAAEG